MSHAVENDMVMTKQWLVITTFLLTSQEREQHLCERDIELTTYTRKVTMLICD